MSPFAADFLETNRRLLAIIAIIVCLATWGVDLAQWVYQCPYCRVQRSAIGVIGLILLLPFYHHWIMRMIGSLSSCAIRSACAGWSGGFTMS